MTTKQYNTLYKWAPDHKNILIKKHSVYYVNNGYALIRLRLTYDTNANIYGILINVTNEFDDVVKSVSISNIDYRNIELEHHINQIFKDEWESQHSLRI